MAAAIAIVAIAIASARNSVVPAVITLNIPGTTSAVATAVLIADETDLLGNTDLLLSDGCRS